MEHLDMETLDKALTELDPSPRQRGRVECIVSRPGINQRLELSEGQLSPEGGLAGDRWVNGHPKRPTEPANPETQIAIMNSKIIDLISGDRARWSLAGDNLFVDLDLSHANLQPGDQLTLGSARLEIVAYPHNGCKKLAQRFGKDVAIWVNTPQGKQQRRRGIYARVIQAGTVRQGDAIEKC